MQQLAVRSANMWHITLNVPFNNNMIDSSTFLATQINDKTHNYIYIYTYTYIYIYIYKYKYIFNKG